MAQVPGMFTTQQQALYKTISTEFMNAAKHFKMKMFLKIYVCVKFDTFLYTIKSIGSFIHSL